ncbi:MULTISPECIES: hypothetical protein [unclassified Pseudomonas]|uniref:hypothetical protein n=1 Tax=unclassified Pseudomonas TaxID=196821 RepID=UPI001431972B|nr:MULTISPECIES: hypothetical protein [unclassified Pseudomonas]
MKHQILKRQSLAIIEANPTGRIALRAVNLVKNPTDEGLPFAGWTRGQRDYFLLEGGAMLLFHHF